MQKASIPKKIDAFWMLSATINYCLLYRARADEVCHLGENDLYPHLV